MNTCSVELGYLAYPEAAGGHPGVVLIPDVFGLSDLYRELARRLADEGFAVLALDLYWREGPPELPDLPAIHAFMSALPDGRVLEDVQAAVDFLAGHPATGGRPVGVAGFCMGGQYALLAACALRGLSACAPFYGMLRYPDERDRALKPRSPLDAIGDLRCPVQGAYGDEDDLIPLADVTALQEALAAAPPGGEVVVHPGCGHAFLNEGREEAFRPEAAARAWARMVSFFRERLT